MAREDTSPAGLPAPAGAWRPAGHGPPGAGRMAAVGVDVRGARAVRAACALVGLAAGLLLGCRAAEPRPSVLLVVVDTLRKDALHLYGEPRPVSPHIDALGAGGWVFESHVAHASQTVPSTLSMLLSQLPLEHGFP